MTEISGGQPPTREFWNRVLTQSVRQADQVGHSLLMVGVLPHERQTARSDPQAVACLEAWLVHVRLLAEFLLAHTSAFAGRDFTAGNFGWKGSATADTSEIEAMWRVASENLVHFSLTRTPADVFDLSPPDVSLEGLLRIAALVLDLAGEFVDFLERDGHEQAVRFRADLDDAWVAHAGSWPHGIVQ